MPGRARAIPVKKNSSTLKLAKKATDAKSARIGTRSSNGIKTQKKCKDLVNHTHSSRLKKNIREKAEEEKEEGEKEKGEGEEEKGEEDEGDEEIQEEKFESASDGEEKEVKDNAKVISSTKRKIKANQHGPVKKAARRTEKVGSSLSSRSSVENEEILNEDEVKATTPPSKNSEKQQKTSHQQPGEEDEKLDGDPSSSSSSGLRREGAKKGDAQEKSLPKDATVVSNFDDLFTEFKKVYKAMNTFGELLKSFEKAKGDKVKNEKTRSDSQGQTESIYLFMEKESEDHSEEDLNLLFQESLADNNDKLNKKSNSNDQIELPTSEDSTFKQFVKPLEKTESNDEAEPQSSKKLTEEETVMDMNIDKEESSEEEGQLEE